MTEASNPPVAQHLVGFFQRLSTIDSVMREIVSHVQISMVMIFRDERERRIALELRKRPMRVWVDDPLKEGQIEVRIRAEVMDEILRGHLHAAVAIGRRELLLRGSPSLFAKVIPLFDFAPMLYREHLAELEKQPKPVEGNNTDREESQMSEQTVSEEVPLAMKRSFFGRMLGGFVGALAYVIGYVLGFMRFRVFKSLSIFDALSGMSKGLEAATPKALKEPPKDGSGEPGA